MVAKHPMKGWRSRFAPSAKPQAAEKLISQNSSCQRGFLDIIMLKFDPVGNDREAFSWRPMYDPEWLREQALRSHSNRRAIRSEIEPFAKVLTPAR